MQIQAINGKPLRAGGKLLKASAGGGTDIGLGVTGATVGDIIKVAAIDAGGKPTAWEAAENGFSILDKSSLITTPLIDKLTWQIGSFSRWGAVCIFTVQFIVDTEISSDYGFDVVTLPYRTTSRIWVNNQSAFWIDARGNTIRRNASTLGTGAYTLSGFYLTNDPE